MGRKSKRVPEHVIKYHFYNNTNRAFKWTALYKNQFAVGDIVNLCYMNGCRVSYKDGCLKRYKVVLIDDIGVIYLRMIARRRGYKKKSTVVAYNLTSFNDYSLHYMRFWHGKDYKSKLINSIKLDEGYINAIMLGERFDPRAEYKARRGIKHATK